MVGEDKLRSPLPRLLRARLEASSGTGQWQAHAHCISLRRPSASLSPRCSPTHQHYYYHPIIGSLSLVCMRRHIVLFIHRLGFLVRLPAKFQTAVGSKIDVDCCTTSIARHLAPVETRAPSPWAGRRQATPTSRMNVDFQVPSLRTAPSPST
ncbi:hypothetical protein BC628DRAFT_1389020 [Trametes gibbosa]|nr:hypothetical protein BC628DRAFT_1389020 [Trametes gibbosa]